MAHKQTEAFVANLADLCAEHGKVQEVADAANLSRVYVSRIINHHAVPTLDVAARIADALGKTLADMLEKKSPRKLARAS